MYELLVIVFVQLDSFSRQKVRFNFDKKRRVQNIAYTSQFKYSDFATLMDHIIKCDFEQISVQKLFMRFSCVMDPSNTKILLAKKFVLV